MCRPNNYVSVLSCHFLQTQVRERHTYTVHRHGDTYYIQYNIILFISLELKNICYELHILDFQHQ